MDSSRLNEVHDFELYPILVKTRRKDQRSRIFFGFTFDFRTTRDARENPEEHRNILREVTLKSCPIPAMSSNSSPAPEFSSIVYSDRTLQRAERAVRCAPFRFRLYETMVNDRVDLRSLSGQSGVQKGYAKRMMTELGAEVELMWLMDVGLLRREVDGQGLTDSFRVTPLGRQVIDRWQKNGWTDRSASLGDRFYNFISRWLRLPF